MRGLFFYKFYFSRNCRPVYLQRFSRLRLVDLLQFLMFIGVQKYLYLFRKHKNVLVYILSSLESAHWTSC